jgi:large subunit ribosomal protein L25
LIIRHTVECLCDPENVPAHFEADLSGLDINDNVRWSDLKGTEGIRPTITDRDFVIATIALPTKAAESAAAATEAAADHWPMSLMKTTHASGSGERTD